MGSEAAFHVEHKENKSCRHASERLNVFGAAYGDGPVTRLHKCSRCGVEPTIFRNEAAMAIEMDCACGSFRWAPSENGDVGERSIEELEEEAISLWNREYGEPASADHE